MIRHKLIATATPRLVTLMSAMLLPALTLPAAELPGPHLSEPQLGFVYDASAQNIRRISGVPGAASLSDTIQTGVSFTQAWVHSASSTAVGITKSGELAAANWGGEAPVSGVLATGLGTIERAAFSRSGGYVAISDGSSVEVWGHLASSPERTAQITADSGVLAVAVNDAGDVAIASAAGQVWIYGDGGSSLVAASSGGRRGTLAGRRTGVVAATGSSWTAVAFLPGGADLVAADGDQLVRIDNISSGASRRVIAGLGGETRALAVSLDGTKIAAAVADGVVVAGTDGSTETVSCNCQAVGFGALSGNLVLQIESADSGSLMVLDADGASARVLEIPRQTNTTNDTTNDGGNAQ